ncbi:LysR family transcriptional regulator [Pseudomonas hunanensis]|uniref:LysR family transcriptional regulator n=1 Tax=Pseudomonas hunanensis TaxID=1247546 RepID=A0ABD6N0L8_9PSED|nr:LysR family transcriptional regulator [Pseudomonas hunanensis]NWL47388.1 LysR family transcriptional regulator [Pseudomonas hunanensis]
MDVFLRGMALFATVVERGSLAAAAQVLGISPSAVSQQLARLEREANISLLHRSTRRLALTEAGRVFYEHCERVLQQAEQARQRLNEFREAPLGELRLAAPAGLASALMSQALKPLLQAHSQLQISVLFQDEILDLVEHRIDLAIRVGPMPDSSLVARHLVDWPCVMCAAPSYLASLPPLREPNQLRELDWLLMSTDPQPDLLRLQSRQGKVFEMRMRSRLNANSILAVKHFALDGIGCAVLPEPEIREHLRSGALQRVLPQWQAPLVGLYAVTARRDALPAKVMVAIEAIAQYLRNREHHAELIR